MPISFEDLGVRAGGPFRSVEVLDTGATAAYTDAIIPPFTTLKLAANDGTIVRICRELLFDGEFGQDEHDESLTTVKPTDVWANDAAGAALEGRWSITGTAPTLDVDGSPIAKSHVAVVALDESDDIYELKASNGRRRRFGTAVTYELAQGIPAGALYTFRIRHLDSDATKLLQYGVKEYRNSASDRLKYWDGSAWQTTIQWVDITGSATEAVFTDDVTIDEGSDGGSFPVTDPSDGAGYVGPAKAYYSVILSPKTDLAAATVHVSNIGLHERCTAALFDVRIAAAEETIITTGPYYSRIGAIADNASKKLYISAYRGK